MDRKKLLEKKIQEKYRDYVKERHLNGAKELRANTEIPFDSETVQFTYIHELKHINPWNEQEKYQELIDDLEEEPLEATVQQAYIEAHGTIYLASKDDHLVKVIKAIERATGIPPTVETLEKGLHYGITSLNNIKSLSSEIYQDIEVSPEIIQEAYNKLAREGDGNRITHLRKATNIKPILLEDSIDEGFKKVFDSYPNPIAIERFVNAIEVVPKEDLVKKACLRRPDEMLKIMQASRTKISLNKTDYMKEYLKRFRKGNVALAEYFKQTLNFNVDVTEEDVELAYSAMLNPRRLKVSDLLILKEEYDGNPSLELIEKAEEEQKDFFNFSSISFTLTDQRDSYPKWVRAGLNFDNLVQEGYRNNLDAEQFDLIGKIYEFTEIPFQISEEEVDPWYDKLFQEGRYSSLAILKSATGIPIY